MKTTSVVSITFSGDIYSEHLRLGRLITGVNDANGEDLIEFPFLFDIEKPLVITHKIGTKKEAFRMKPFINESLTPDTIEIHFEGLVKKVLTDELIKRSKQALQVMGIDDISIVSAKVDVSFTVVETLALEI